MQGATHANGVELAQEYWGKTGRLLRAHGFLGLAVHLLRRVTHSLVDMGSVTFFEKELTGEAHARASTDWTVRQLRASDKEALLHGSESAWDVLSSRFSAGDLCFAALDEQGRAVHTRWVTLTGARIPELQMDFVPTPDAAYFYDGYTRPDARRRGVDALVRADIFQALRALGRSRVYSYVRDDNPEGSRAAGRCQRAVGTVRHLRLFGWSRLLFGGDSARLTALLRKPRSAGPDDAANRAEAWRSWFLGWLREPLAKRSIGFHELPEDAFQAMAQHIGATLGLDRSRDLVLDLGCDSALVSRWVAPQCARLVGIDFIAGMLLDARRRAGDAALPWQLCFAAADGRRLPFASATFAKAYCSGVVHTLPSREDGLAMILELVRVSAPGGRVLVAAVPDARKRWPARRAAWRAGGLREKAHIVAAAALPPRLRRLARRLAPWLPPAPLRYLEYDLEGVKTFLQGRGVGCAIVDYPPDFWSRDFRETRSSLLIDVPPKGREGGSANTPVSS